MHFNIRCDNSPAISYEDTTGMQSTRHYQVQGPTGKNLVQMKTNTRTVYKKTQEAEYDVSKNLLKTFYPSG